MRHNARPLPIAGSLQNRNRRRWREPIFRLVQSPASRSIYSNGLKRARSIAIVAVISREQIRHDIGIVVARMI